MSCSMDSLVNGVDSSLKIQNSASVSSHHESPSLTQSKFEGASTTFFASAHNDGTNTFLHPNGSAINRKCLYKTLRDNILNVELPHVAEHLDVLKTGLSEIADSSEVLAEASENSLDDQELMVETNYIIKHPVDGPKSSNSNGSLASESNVEGDDGQLSHRIKPQSAVSFCASPSNRVFTTTLYAEAKQSFTNTEVTEEASTVQKSNDSDGTSNSCNYEGQKTSMYRESTDSDVSDESSSSSLSGILYKPHKADDVRWEAIQAVRCRIGALGINNFRLLRRLGCGDIGSVYLSELTGTRTYFAMKVMDKAALAARKKLLRAQTEREILQSLDHPFLPTLYMHFETEKLSCLVMEFCPGGDLHALRQRQPGKYFPEHAARFYVAEVLLALEYLHMLGIVYRDLKPENVLVREDGHIMLSDFDLSLRCAVCPTLVKSSNSISEPKTSAYFAQPVRVAPTCTMQPDCIQPVCFVPRFLSKKPRKTKQRNETNHQASLLPELVAEPTNARSMSFVGTHEYLAPEIIKGEGHGSAVDWWTLGVFLYELLFGRTPFKGSGNRATLFNVIGQPLKFPESPPVSFAARDLIRGLLVKEPQHRLAYRRGATEIKQHAFFQSVNWALIRCVNPPEVPKKPLMEDFVTTLDAPKAAPPATGVARGVDVKNSGNYLEIDFF